MPCTHYEGTLAAVRALRARGMYVVALETTEDAVPLGTAPQLADEARGVAIVLGNEAAPPLHQCGPLVAPRLGSPGAPRAGLPGAGSLHAPRGQSSSRARRSPRGAVVPPLHLLSA